MISCKLGLRVCLQWFVIKNKPVLSLPARYSSYPHPSIDLNLSKYQYYDHPCPSITPAECFRKMFVLIHNKIAGRDEDDAEC